MTRSRAEYAPVTQNARPVLLSVGLAIGTLGLGPAPAAAEFKPMQVAVLQGLDKVTARISTFEAPLDQTVTFGTLEITARTCQTTPPEEPPESAAFVEIVDARPDRDAVDVFSGWMFASSPALSALEHPVYDVWVIDCVATSAEAPRSEELGPEELGPEEPGEDSEQQNDTQ